jgi:hypothetical protein
MAFISVTENKFVSTLVDVNRLNEKSFNPSDYFEFSTRMKTSLDKLSSIAETKIRRALVAGNKRLFSGGIDRVTGEVLPQSVSVESEGEEVSCVEFHKNDILFHRIGARIGRIGLTDSDGYGENEILTVKPVNINGYYLLTALRLQDVLIQLPFRETARPRIKRNDIRNLMIPRLGKVEADIGNFVGEIFDLRKRARNVLNGLLDNFDKAISAKMPTDYSFLMATQTISEETLDPGSYFIKAISVMFPQNEILDDIARIIYPPSLNAGNSGTALTLNDYRFEGIVPQALKSVDRLQSKNFASLGDLILNRLQSGEEKVAKATVVLKDLGYLSRVNLTLDIADDAVKVPIYDQLFILKMKKSSKVSPYYLSVIFNSRLFQYLFLFLMSGSTGRQRLRKSKLKLVKFPILSEYMMKAFSEATRICMEAFSETLRMLIELVQKYESVVRGESPIDDLTLLINREQGKIVTLRGNCMQEAATELLKTDALDYPINNVLLG